MSRRAIPALKCLFLTSLRDVFGCDKNGIDVQTSTGPQYMMGLIEYVALATKPGGPLHGVIEVTGVVYDDTERELSNYGLPTKPTIGQPWIHPLDLENDRGIKITDLTKHIPSMFRRLPQIDTDGRRAEKRQFEFAVHDFMLAMDADIIVSDHYMARIEYLIGELNLSGRVLNIHPAVTKLNHPFCFRGPHPTADALDMAKKKAVQLSPEVVRTGATLHYVNSTIDDGEIIHFGSPTTVNPDWEPEELRYHNYRKAKFPMFVQGMMEFHRRGLATLPR